MDGVHCSPPKRAKNSQNQQAYLVAVLPRLSCFIKCSPAFLPRDAGSSKLIEAEVRIF
jgi:hypothetical protein